MDREAVTVLVAKLMEKTRSHLPVEEMPCFTEAWPRDWKRRKGFPWRENDTYRRPSTIADISEDNQWRRLVLDVFNNPEAHGLHMPAGLRSIPPKVCLALDETPLQYFPQQKGTYECANIQNVFIAHGKEKHAVTRTPVTNMAGQVILFQILWKGKSARCHAKISGALCPHISKVIVQDHARCKTQTRATFEALCKHIIEKCTEILRSEGLPLDTRLYW